MATVPSGFFVNDVPIPGDEDLRLRDLERFELVGGDSDVHLDRLVELAQLIFGVPMAAISLVTRTRQWFLAEKGLNIRETPRGVAFCAHAILENGVMVVPNALEDERFRTNPLVVSAPQIRFYAGAPLRSRKGHNLGTVCVIDSQPMQPTPVQIRELELLSQLVMRELDLRRERFLCPVTGLPIRQKFLRIAEGEFRRAHNENKPLSLLLFDIDHFRFINNRWGHHSGDEVMADLCKMGRQFLREEDFAGRLGDGEFALLLVDTPAQEALVTAESLRRAVATMPGVHSHSDLQLHISGGLTSLGPHDESFTPLLQRAEQALHLAKSNGRNQIATLLDGMAG
ncbi:MAG: sensor domain-containing diguanylate cyclase [Cyanobacteriota bacterium]|jgi:diguanylate cyclase (GGDEF)-like protein|nr:sensor domain-containing diguanylate cyclase [Cyanobacteriota bacterium]